MKLSVLLKKVRRKAFMLSVDPVLVPLGAKIRSIAGLYYLLEGSFGLEQKSFLEGRRRYQVALSGRGGNISLLRRNTHRLEKGILMRPRRVPFGLDYIGETVRAWVAVSEGCSADPDLDWSRDVLAEYFRIVGDHPKTAEYKRQFQQSGVNLFSCDEGRIPYLREIASEIPTYESLKALAIHRRSVRWFLDKPVDRKLIDQAIEIAALSPSACNRQPFQFRIIDDPALCKSVVGLSIGMGGYGHNVPVMAVLVGRQRNFFSERDRHLIYIDSSLASMSFLYGLEVQGLSSCCVNWPDIYENEKKMIDLLRLEPDERPIMLIALGHPDPEGMVANSAKKSLGNIRRYNFE